jgi:fermentation-respiration switch protein FrsA (DUF1100 family)
MIAPRPLFMIIGTDAVTAWMTTDAFASAQKPKEMCWIKGPLTSPFTAETSM